MKSSKPKAQAHGIYQYDPECICDRCSCYRRFSGLDLPGGPIELSKEQVRFIQDALQLAVHREIMWEIRSVRKAVEEFWHLASDELGHSPAPPDSPGR